MHLTEYPLNERIYRVQIAVARRHIHASIIVFTDNTYTHRRANTETKCTQNTNANSPLASTHIHAHIAFMVVVVVVGRLTYWMLCRAHRRPFANYVCMWVNQSFYNCCHRSIERIVLFIQYSLDFSMYLRLEKTNRPHKNNKTQVIMTNVANQTAEFLFVIWITVQCV